MNQKSNKNIVLEFYKHIIGERNIQLIDTYVGEQYIQHSPMLKDGKAGLREAIAYLKQLPAPTENKSPIVRIIEDGDFVVVHLDLVFMEKRQIVMDLFRLKHGKIVEHWDAIQYLSEPGISDTKAIQEGIFASDKAFTEKNKSLITQFFQDIRKKGFRETEKEYSSSSRKVVRTEIVKSPTLLNFLANKSLRDLHTVHRILGEGNFVVVQSAGEKGGNPFVFYDIFKIKNNVVLEYWCVKQAIPAVMPHRNGMI